MVQLDAFVLFEHETWLQAQITVGVGPRHYTTVGPSLTHLSPNYTENKYVNRATIFSSVYSNRAKYSAARSLRELNVYSLLLTKLQCIKKYATDWLTYVQNIFGIYEPNMQKEIRRQNYSHFVLNRGHSRFL